MVQTKLINGYIYLSLSICQARPGQLCKHKGIKHYKIKGKLDKNNPPPSQLPLTLPLPTLMYNF